MFSIRIGGTLWRAGVPFFCLLSLLLTLDQSGTAALCLLASFVHEFGHVAVLWLGGRPPREITVGVCGIRLIPHEKPLPPAAEAVMLCAGSAVNLAFAWVLYRLSVAPLAVATHAVLGVFNLLPVEALDGGQLLRWLLSRRWGETVVHRAVRAVSVVVVLPLATVGFWLLLRAHNPTLLLVSGYLIARLFTDERI